MKLLLFKCNHGHYFRHLSCPYDGWTHADIRRAENAFLSDGADSLAALEHLEIDDDLLERIVIIEKRNCDEQVEGLAPESYVINGEVVVRNEVGADLL